MENKCTYQLIGNFTILNGPKIAKNILFRKFKEQNEVTNITVDTAEKQTILDYKPALILLVNSNLWMFHIQLDLIEHGWCVAEIHLFLVKQIANIILKGIMSL